MKEQPRVTVMALFSLGHLSSHLPRAWYSNTCLSNPPAAPRPVYLQNEFLSALHLLSLEDLEELGNLRCYGLILFHFANGKPTSPKPQTCLPPLGGSVAAWEGRLQGRHPALARGYFPLGVAPSPRG